MDRTYLLAHVFTARVRDTLTAAELDEVRARNATPEYAGYCATHDFIDANVLMAEAMAHVGVDIEDTATINKAWAIAHAAKFNI